MNITHFQTLALAALSLALTACNHETPVHGPNDDGDPDAGRYHENSFSWTDPTGPLAKSAAVAELSTKVTDFADGDAFVAAMLELETRLEDPEFSRSLWKPLDHACDELDLALWNTHGTVRVADSTVFDESILRSRCTYVGDGGDVLGKASGTSSTNPPSVVTDRQYPYKMIGTSWSEVDRIIYRTTGSETMFKKHREFLWKKAWWDTDASRVGVRVYYFECGRLRNDIYTPVRRACREIDKGSDWDSNDDYVSDRFINPRPKVQIEFTLLPSGNVAPNVVAGSAKVYNGVIGMHSVNHAGRIFRATSSSGMGAINIGSHRSYVTW